MKVYVAGHIIAETEQGTVWDILGVFDLRYLAEQACYDEAYFVGPLEVNQALPKEIIGWPEAYFPKHEQEKGGDACACEKVKRRQ